MIPKFLNRNILQRIFGVPATPRPRDPQCWTFSDRKIIIDLKRAPELERLGGALRLESGRLPLRVLIVHGEDGAYYAFHNRCTHLGHRRFDPVPGTGTVQCCSVGKSTYAYDGRKIYGPAPEPIHTLKTEFDGERLIVSLE
jgi:Rieske Fe-S protein